MRLDRLLGQHPRWSRRHVRQLLALGQVRVNGQPQHQATWEVTRFCRVEADGELLQAGQAAHYLMLHKPAGLLSATEDPLHPTVMTLLPQALQGELHIAGRLDRASTGLLVLTNDGNWSRRLTDPASDKAKTYRVTLANPVDPDTARVFAEGIHFPFEDIVTRPVQLEQLGEREVRLTLTEGRYHQIKRMFGRFRNPVLALHRESMGPLQLGTLPQGQYRRLTDAEVAAI
ncbi:pseudouridine synthase [Ferrimonas marina]|uniref:Pseudouridine synthase n=1 Tax=Ferrimonas marina TaxID=299255 RepID=A0A1M5VU94_9GAMM|nr:16S rRNA pseudouridine(516) synthase [Ferrimonas marina]SHH78826.1 16S rRNA pseudouridine516 synthase [Ferrimonas marina]